MTFETALAEIKHLSFDVNGQSILDDVSLLIRKGEYCAIIGPNGGGKTTLIRLMLGLELPRITSYNVCYTKLLRDVVTICIGQAASMGAFLLSSGAKGKRYALPHARIRNNFV